MSMAYEFDAVTTVARLRLRNAPDVQNEEGRRFHPDRIEVHWVWRPRRGGWAWAYADVTGPYEGETLRAVPFDAFAGPGMELPRQLDGLVDVTRPAWTPPSECSECGTPVNVAEQHNQLTGKNVPLCPACHHEAVSGT
ncbi:hypothetical protein [Nonomuraea sp. JJY05]|uniref:hypothetical protein n=1 Tax=Nonomuraea sp. JJY05 TaxID=3350255 RepID=UPI00373E2BE3